MIPVLFNILFLLIPLIFFKTTSELFEFNKIITLYIFTTLIMVAWLYKSIVSRKFIFRRTILDWPLIGYLVTLLISSLVSIDPRTSWFGYYSRFNGGLISQICYALLYWAFVSNLTAKQSLYAVRYSLYATAIASLLAVLEHFGIFTTCGLMNLGWRDSCWVQDVQTRVFSTLGQPNWLAALLVTLIPITFAYSLRHMAYSILSILFFATLLFTGSRSGLLAFGIESILFWSLIYYKFKFLFLKHFLFLNFIFAFCYLIFNVLPINQVTNNQPSSLQGPSLETGGTESGTIRKYVWAGAINVFKHHPILGTGPETFAFSFPMYKPIEHNLTSEWDFVYNKAHNEYLNCLANTGIIGFLSYLILIVFSIKQIINNQIPTSKQIQNINYLNKNKFNKLEFRNLLLFDHWLLIIGILSGYASILVTNFFGFSVVPVSLLFFLFPAFAVVQSTQYEVLSKPKTKLETGQIVLVVLILCTMYFVLSTIYHYWKADIHYNRAKLFNKSGNVALAKQEITKSLKFSPNEPLYLNELAIAENNIEISQKALSLSHNNINLVRSLAGIYNRNNKLEEAINTLLEETKNHPNDPKLYYQIGVYLIKLNNLENAKIAFIKSIELKPNYKDARFALGLTYIDLKEFDLAKKELKYILEFIDPKDELTKKYLEEID